MLIKNNSGIGLCLRVALAISVTVFPAAPAAAYSDQTTTERVLNENKGFIDFMDVCVTNFGDEQRERFREIYRHHFNAEVSFLQSDYKAAFKRLYLSEGVNAGLFADMARDIYLEGAKDILDSIAPEIIRSKNSRAKLYLTLGYRDRAVGFNYYTIGMASNPKLYSYKIYKYIDTVKMSRRAKRYAFLALYESRSDEMKTKIFNHLFEMEREAGNPFYSRFLAKNGDAFLNELNRDYYESTPTDASAEKTKGEADAEAGSFEKKTERRVRFRAEKTVAQYILNREFEKAEDTIREYVDDFNFKIIKAMLEMLSAEGSGSPGGVDYRGFLPHHTDNYVRYSKESALASFSGSIKVEDYVEKSGPGEKAKPGDGKAAEGKDAADHDGEERVEGKK